MTRKYRHSTLAVLALSAGTAFAQSIDWPAVQQEAKPGTRWWWMGSEVDSTNLKYNLETYAKAGIGAVEITPIYGVIGNEANEIDYLSPRWMQMLGYTEEEAKRVGIQVDMNNGTGWPFGGPEVTLEESACRAIFHQWKSGESQPTLSRRDSLSGATLAGIWSYPAGPKQDTTFVALYIAHTLQQVKRAAPGGEGWVMDHLNPQAVAHYFERFDKAFAASGAPIPHSFFNDSYEVYDADWTPAMLDEFEKRRGYKLQDHFPAFLDTEATDHKRLISDYRETMSDLLLEVFTHTWADWAHKHGAKVRNQAHGSPAVLLDVYGAVDIPEIEGFGLSDFGIKGLRTDSLWKKNDADLSMYKYASSAAHVMGKSFTSSETFTWLTEHFRTSLSQCKPDFDLLMVGGVNHAYFHGTTYSPQEAEWPGHLFYASMEMSPINPIWRDAPAFFRYITRVQSFMQWGKPDNDLLMYMPIYDIWYQNPGRLLMLAIHGMEKKSPRFVKAVTEVYDSGYDMDYISDRMIMNCRVVDGRIVTEGGTSYKALMLPEVQIMQPETMLHLVELCNQGGTIIVVGGYPEEVPGMKDRQLRVGRLADAVCQFPTILGTESSAKPMGKGRIITATNYKAALELASDIKPEIMKSEYGLKNIRRTNPMGHHYFISALMPDDVDAFIPLAVRAEQAVLFDPMTGEINQAQLRQRDGVTEVRLQLKSGQSCILQTLYSPLNQTQKLALKEKIYTQPDMAASIDLTSANWHITASPKEMQGIGTAGIDLRMNHLVPFTAIQAAQNAMGTGTYTTTLKLSGKQLSQGSAGWLLDLGDVRESARVFVNGKEVATLFSVPYELNIGPYLKAGKNEIRIEVTGLAANYIAQMDRDGREWRRFKNANIAVLPGYDKDPKNKSYAHWGTIPFGLNSTVKLIPLK